jgi:hypothetical protein
MKYRTGVSMVVAAGVIGIGSIAIAGVGIGLAAATPAGTIHACVAKSDGTLRVVHSAHDCTGHEDALSFNSRGPRGPRGAPGPQGPQGPRGAPGSSGGGGTTAPATFQMFANVDQHGDLGSNSDATSADLSVADARPDQYDVIFSKPVTACAIMVTPGYADGNLTADYLVPNVSASSSDPDHVTIRFGATTASNQTVEGGHTAFMVTVTCKS